MNGLRKRVLLTPLQRAAYGGVALTTLLLIACGSDKCKNGPCNNGNNTNGAIQAKVDVSGAYGLLVVDNSSTASLKLMEKHNKTVEKLGLDAPTFTSDPQSSLTLEGKSKQSYKIGKHTFTFPDLDHQDKLALDEITATETGTGSGDASSSSNPTYLQKIDSQTGEVTDALTQVQTPNAFNANQKLPKLSTIAISPTKDIFLHFEQSFIYKDAPPDQDPWNQSNGYQCQIFKVAGGTLDDLLAAPPSLPNLQCLDNMHFINSFQTFTNGVYQFDDTGDVYYPGSIPNTNKTVVYKMSRDGTNNQEVINANICVNNFLVTPSGGTFYTGNTCPQGSGGGGPADSSGGFFRYVSPGANGGILEIARNWWNFIFDTAVTTDKTDLAVFFGPDPRSATTASWDSACLFSFNPAGTDVNSRIGEVITCGNNINDWMSLQRTVDVANYGQGYNNYSGTDQNHTPSQAWKKEFGRRCATKNEVFAGGGSQISAIQQTSTGEIYVIGNIRKKQEGELLCSVAFRGPHCSISNMPVLVDASDKAYSQTSCIANNGTWVNEGNCSNGTTKATGCVDTHRTWTPGFCSNGDYPTKAGCIAATGCSNRWYNNQTDCTNSGFTWHAGPNGTNGGLVWRLGNCSSDQDKYETEAACTTAGKIWRADTWSGQCSSSDTTDQASLFNNNQNSCIPTWSTNQVWYNNVNTDICTTAENGNRKVFWDNSNKANNFTKTADANHLTYADLSANYIVDRLDCKQLTGSNGNNNWTTEYAALAKVDSSKKTLKLLSLPTEKAINLWVVADKAYYSSYDTNSGSYLLNGLQATPSCIDTSIEKKEHCTATNASWKERNCFMTALTTADTCTAAGYDWELQYPWSILSNFEIYNLAQSEKAGDLLADGLDFKTNQYQFGTISPTTKAITLRTGLTGTLKTIIILPKRTP